MKKSSLQITVGTLLTSAVLVLIATCYVSYRNLSSIVSSVQADIKPELKLVSIRDISGSLERADNSIRLYTVTKDTLDLRPYYKAISGIDEKVSLLREESLNDSLLLSQIDTISLQIEKNIIAWNHILLLTHDNKVVENLKKLSDKVDSAAVNNQKKGRGILRRVFSSGNKSSLDEMELAANLQQIEQQDSLAKEKMKEREVDLAGISSNISNKLYGLIEKMEDEIFSMMKEKALEADQIAGKTYVWLILFSISGGLMALLVLFIIIRYTRKTHASQLALEYSKSEAENLARAKEMFMANMSHEIRTPVTAIAGFTDQLLHESMDEEMARSVRIIKASSDYLVRIINDILDFSKLQNGKPELENLHFRIRHLFEEVYTIFEHQAATNNIKLSYSISEDMPMVLCGDPYRLKQILINLVSNAVKFTNDGEVKYSIDCIKREAPAIELIIQVTDTGIGIDEKKQKIIFDDFTQAEINTSRKYGGTGLGLSIVRKIVELHRGKIECDSRLNHGTKITCSMPYITGDEKQVKEEAGKPADITGKIRDLHILVVDDEEYNRLLFKKILTRWNARFDEAANGREALAKLKENQYDLLFMDIRMPETDGLEATKLIREELKITAQMMPIICISAFPPDEDLQKYSAAGMNAFLQKPFNEDMLLLTVKNVLRDSKPEKDVKLKTDDKNKVSFDNRLNLSDIYHISGGDELFVKQMLESFITTTEKGLKDLKDLILSGQYDAAAEIAHKLIPPCRHLGAGSLANYLQMIEKGIRTTIDENTLETLAGDSAMEFDAVRQLLLDYIAKIS